MEYRCDICDKKYSSYQSLWIHNKKFHNNNITNNHENITNNHENITNNHENITNNHENITNNHELIKVVGKISQKLQCKFCNKLFKHYQNKWDHEKNYCKSNPIPNNNKKDIITSPNANIQLTVNNDNKQINNGTINNQHIIINQFGSEKLDILAIVKDGNNMPITCIQKINFNKKYPKNHSFCTTTLEGKHFTKINHKTQKPEKINKADFINQILDNSLKVIQNIGYMIEFDEDFRNSIPQEYQNKLKEIIDNNEKFYEPKNKKAFFNCINDMSYNFKDLIFNTWKLLQPIKDNFIDNNNETNNEFPFFDESKKYYPSDSSDD